MKKLISAAFLSNLTIRAFEGKLDAYRGFNINYNAIDKYRNNQELFEQDLKQLFIRSAQENWKAIWIELSKDQLDFAQILVNKGFKMHNCSQDRIRFSKWLLDEPSRLPHQSTHFVGVGGVIIKEGKILMVQEKNGIRKGAWGVPGGLVDQGETVYQGITREIKEETNLDCSIDDIMLFREVENFKFGKSDMYFLFKMKLNDQQQPITIDQKELMDYRWVDINILDQFLLEQKARQIVIDFYKEVQESLLKQKENGNKNFMKFELFNELYWGKFQQFGVFKPNF
ncbi:hypothetical protein pb186bvf_013752 [Paramecium bursaria]